MFWPLFIQPLGLEPAKRQAIGFSPPALAWMRILGEPGSHTPPGFAYAVPLGLEGPPRLLLQASVQMLLLLGSLLAPPHSFLCAAQALGHDHGTLGGAGARVCLPS